LKTRSSRDKGPFHGSYTPVNVTLAVLGVISSSTLALRVWTHTRGGKVRLEGANGDADGTIQEEDEGEE